MTVSTPFGGVENETVVTFTNAVNTGQFKICKVSSEPTLQGVPFNFTYAQVTESRALRPSLPGQCSAAFGEHPGR